MWAIFGAKKGEKIVSTHFYLKNTHIYAKKIVSLQRFLNYSTMYLLGYDIGSSSVKASLIEAESGKCIAQTFYPKEEAPIISHKAGWAEQDPEQWWQYVIEATKSLSPALKGTLVSSDQPFRAVHHPKGERDNAIVGIGISYQMHGLVCVDRDQQVLRPAIIWCDSRAAQYGTNFTAGKLRWVKDNEPDIYSRTYKIMLPGDYIAMRLTGKICTTESGISEMDWRDELGLDKDKLPEIVPTFGEQGRVRAEAAALLGLPEGVPVCYRAGDQPNNALSLGVLHDGEIASTAGTSGVVYGVTTSKEKDAKNRVNNFIHVNGLTGVLLCINGTGILNSWMHHHVAPDLSYAQMNEEAAKAPIGCNGLSVLPFGNGAERMLENAEVGCSVHGLSFTQHKRAHLLRAAQEGIVFSFMYGIEVMQSMGMKIEQIHAGNANMFLSPIFRETLAGVSGATIYLHETDGAAGAAKGAGIGAGFYKTPEEAFETLKTIAVIEPKNQEAYREAYARWKRAMGKCVNV